MTSEGLFEGDFEDMRGRKFPIMSMGGRAEGLACPYPVARTPIGIVVQNPGRGCRRVCKFLHGLLNNINKNSGKKIKFGPPPPGSLEVEL
jgi:hypothetical protein